MDKNAIFSTPKNSYKKKIKDLVNKAALKYFLQVKEDHTKLNETIYTEFVLQPYLTTK